MDGGISWLAADHMSVRRNGVECRLATSDRTPSRTNTCSVLEAHPWVSCSQGIAIAEVAGRRLGHWVGRQWRPDSLTIS